MSNASGMLRIPQFLPYFNQKIDKIPMKKESNISLSGTLILRALFSQRYTPLYEKGIKQYQNKPMETILHCTKRA